MRSNCAPAVTVSSRQRVAMVSTVYFVHSFHAVALEPDVTQSHRLLRAEFSHRGGGARACVCHAVSPRKEPSGWNSPALEFSGLGCDTLEYRPDMAESGDESESGDEQGPASHQPTFAPTAPAAATERGLDRASADVTAPARARFRSAVGEVRR